MDFPGRGQGVSLWGAVIGVGPSGGCRGHSDHTAGDHEGGRESPQGNECVRVRVCAWGVMEHKNNRREVHSITLLGNDQLQETRHAVQKEPGDS